MKRKLTLSDSVEFTLLYAVSFGPLFIFLDSKVTPEWSASAIICFLIAAAFIASGLSLFLYNILYGTDK